MHILKWFTKVSILVVNNEKTIVAKSRALRGRGIPWKQMYGSEWTNTFNTKGISNNVDEMGRIT